MEESRPLCLVCGERPRRGNGRKKNGAPKYSRECSRCSSRRYRATPRGRENKQEQDARHRVTPKCRASQTRAVANRARRGLNSHDVRSTGAIAEGLHPGFCLSLWELQEHGCAVCGRSTCPAKFWCVPDLVAYEAKSVACMDHRHSIWRKGQPLDTFWASLSGLLCARCNSALSSRPSTGPRTRIDTPEMAGRLLAYLTTPPAQRLVLQLGLQRADCGLYKDSGEVVRNLLP